MGFVSLQEINFISLQTAVFCAECELISHNNTGNCFACGSQAILSLSRILGGTMRGQQTAHLIADAELDRLVRDLLRTVPASSPRNVVDIEADIDIEDRQFASAAPGRHHARAMHARNTLNSATHDMDLQSEGMDIEPAIHVIAERAQALTGATGSAIALRRGGEIVCRARTGRTAPDLGVRLQTDSGISAQCVRTGQVVLCHDTEENSRVDLSTCRHLGVRSILAAPLRCFPRTLGVFEVLSSYPHAFDQHDVATMQFLSSMMVAAISRLSKLRTANERNLA
ncbi:MAG TPA: GAF domain-containing protein [Terriglobales bacterium]|nr:GAF domain-containing protein [Terriglobales bacterium]